VFNLISKSSRRMEQMPQRILIVDPQPERAKMLGELMRDLCRADIWSAPSVAKALKLAAKVDAQLIFCELGGDKVDGIALTRKLRRSDLACRQAPVVLVAHHATTEHRLAARDAGAHELLHRPFTLKDLTRRVEAAVVYPRDWVEAVDYVGPDRRRFASADYNGPLKRLADHVPTSDTVRIGQALKILKSAVSALEREPEQAVRAILAQAMILQAAADGVADRRLAAAAHELHQHVFAAAKLGEPPLRAEVERRAAPLLAQLPRDDRAAA
jgi:CheY-like chemotaxis protein